MPGWSAPCGRQGTTSTALEIPIDETNFESVLASYARCYDVDASAFDVVISTKAPTYMVRHPRHVNYLLHTLRVFYDRFDAEFGAASETLQTATPPDPPARQGGAGTLARPRALRQRAHDLRAPVRRRLVVAAGSLYRPAPSARARRIPAASTRRIRVSSRTAASMEARGARRPGVQAAEARHPAVDRRNRRGRAAGPPGGRWRPRIRFLGAVTDDQLLDLYAGALVVPFVPVQEDYGLITIEAFKSQKPVITCRDSGETLQFVKDGVTGCVVEPEEGALADRLAYLVDHPDAAAEMGTRAGRSVAHIGWEPIVSALLDAATGSARKTVGMVPARERAQRLPRLGTGPRRRRSPCSTCSRSSPPSVAGGCGSSACITTSASWSRRPTLAPTTGLAQATAITS